MDTVGDDRSRLHLHVADGSGAVTPLDEWMSAVTAELHRQGRAIRHLGERAAEAGQELAALKSSLADIRLSAQGFRGVSADLRHRLDDLDRRLNNILALYEQHFGSGQTEQGMHHHDHAAEYAALVEQKIVGLALDALPGGLHATTREKAAFVSAVCADLFGAGEISEQQLIGRLPETASPQAVQRMHEICAEARALRAKVAHGRPQRWEFGCEIDGPIDEQWQEPWTGAARDGVIEFVVAPAYLVDANTLLRKQKVFTSPAALASRDASAAGD